ncbi:pol [Symbiodinium sp. CCMP2456]|nr:pol [Symbiodinium sp. CCMP2456]
MPDSLLSKLTFRVHSGQLFERCFAPTEFLEFTDPTDTLTVFIHEDLTKANPFAGMQLVELGFDLEGDRCGPNRVAEGYLIDMWERAWGLLQKVYAPLGGERVPGGSILNDEVATEAYYQANRAFLHNEFLQVKSLGEIQLQEFFEIANYSRDQIGPKLAVAFPITPWGLEAVKRLMRLMRKATCLAVPPLAARHVCRVKRPVDRIRASRSAQNHAAARAGWSRRWWGMLSVAVQQAVATAGRRT